MTKEVAFFKRSYSEATENRMLEVLRSGFLTSGKVGIQTEQLLEGYFDIAGAALVNSWTNGAVVALSCLGISSGDEVIVPAMTFIATASCVKSVNAVPILCDVSLKSGNVEWEYIKPKITNRTKAIFVVHLYGVMVDVEYLRSRLEELGRHDIHIIEDAAHCFEGELNGCKPGYFSSCAIFSFYATKNISCGEGGAIISTDKKFIEDCKISRLHGMTGTAYDRYTSKSFRHYDVEKFAYKANLPDILACMLAEQIQQCDSVLMSRDEAANIYRLALGSLIASGKVRLQVFDSSRTKHAWHLFVVLVNKDMRDWIIDFLNNSGIGVAVNFRSLSQLSEYSDFSIPNAERWGSECISLPFYPGIPSEEINYVVEILKMAFKKIDGFPKTAKEPQCGISS